MFVEIEGVRFDLRNEKETAEAVLRETEHDATPVYRDQDCTIPEGILLTGETPCTDF